jgi:Cu+-exporting ATPase
MPVDSTRAAGSIEFSGHTFYFCGLKCLDKFEQEPQRYAGASERTDDVGERTGEEDGLR